MKLKEIPQENSTGSRKQEKKKKACKTTHGNLRNEKGKSVPLKQELDDCKRNIQNAKKKKSTFKQVQQHRGMCKENKEYTIIKETIEENETQTE